MKLKRIKDNNSGILLIALALLVIAGVIAYLLIIYHERYLLSILFLLAVSIGSVVFFNRKVNKPIRDFKEFLNLLQKGHGNYENISFSKNELGEIEEKIIQTFKQLEETKRYKQQLTHNIAHELKTPVTSIRGYLETLMQQEMDKDQRKFFIERAYMQTLRLSSLITDISTLNNIEEASWKYETEKINIKKCIEEIESDLSFSLSENNIKLYTDVSNNIEIEGVYILIYSLFKNLIDNSIEHAGRDLEIHIQTTKIDPDIIWFRYYDTGKGVSEEHLERLFERFYRVEAGRSRKSGGSGLGLSIVKNSVLLHNGSITVCNREEGGLQFDFSLSAKMYQ
ncbi:MAG: HAMP domain-containing sensor histidine kinase [Rikenellaceae bacterium]|jgi:two-component system phosphate regulon sensor histidine kinase PhoR